MAALESIVSFGHVQNREAHLTLLGKFRPAWGTASNNLCIQEPRYKFNRLNYMEMKSLELNNASFSIKFQYC